MQTKKARSKRQEQRVSRMKSLFFFLLASCFFSLSATAQCAMCRASLESEGNKTRVEAVNDGIVLLMAVPYIIAGLIGFAVYRMYFRKSKTKE
jgi:hypothetical protein